MDWIQGERFINLRSENIFFCKTEHVNDFFINCDKNKPFILISHCSDGSVTDNPRAYNYLESYHHADVRLMPDNCKKWFACMIDYDGYEDKRIVPLPLGVENNINFINEGKRDILIKEKNKKVEKYEDKLVFVNFKISNNYSERIDVFNSVKDTDFCTFTECMFTQEQLDKPKELFPHINKLNYSDFASEIHKHYFMICPVGNGLDSHRLWEALHLNCIPITRRITNYIQYEDKLPILFVDNWSDITKELLLQKKEEIRIKKESGFYNMNMIDFSYWESLIINESKKIKI